MNRLSRNFPSTRFSGEIRRGQEAAPVEIATFFTLSQAARPGYLG
jgi:hypothetical protein